MAIKVEDAEWTTKLIDILDEFRKINQNVTANQIVTFLHIGLNDNITQKELEKATGLDNGTVSRLCAVLSDRGLKQRDAKPMDLIRIGMAEDDYRARSQSLSSNGKRVFNALRAIMRGK